MYTDALIYFIIAIVLFAASGVLVIKSNTKIAIITSVIAVVFGGLGIASQIQYSQAKEAAEIEAEQKELMEEYPEIEIEIEGIDTEELDDTAADAIKDSTLYEYYDTGDRIINF